MNDETKPKETIRIFIVGSDDKKAEYEIKKTVILNSLLGKYCKMKNLDIQNILMTHGSKVLDLSKSIEENGVENGDSICIMGRQEGG